MARDPRIISMSRDGILKSTQLVALAKNITSANFYGQNYQKDAQTLDIVDFEEDKEELPSIDDEYYRDWNLRQKTWHGASMKLIERLDEKVMIKTLKELGKHYKVRMSKQRSQQALDDFFKLFNRLNSEMQRNVEIGIIAHTFVTKTFNSESSTFAQMAFFLSKALEMGAKVECKPNGEFYINGQQLKLNLYEGGFTKIGEEKLKSLKYIENMEIMDEEELPSIDDEYYRD